jgi:two-component system, NtrC family, response regulator AtoC
MAKQDILVIDDDALMREYVAEAMARAGHAAEAAPGGAEGLALFEEKGHDLVITDLKMTPVGGQQVVEKIHAASPSTPVIVMTAYGTIETAVAALKAGASDYILKPFTPDAIELAVSRAFDRLRLAAENRYLRSEVNAAWDFEHMVGGSPPMEAVYDQIRKVAASRANVLVRGETGTGKELVARAIHHASPRREKPFIKVNCAALSAGILESELFGHEKGAFTSAHERKIGRFELADSGSLLLDEISEIDIALQPKLLRALQEREFERVGGTQTISVDTRIIATSNRNIEEAVENGHFRKDLFFRLNVITIHLPPLRSRREDIPALMDAFLERFNRENGRRVRGFTEAAQRLLTGYDWPGNVRELQNAIERAVVLAPGDMLGAEDFQLAGAGARRGGIEAGVTVAEVEKTLIFKTLEHCDQNRTRAAGMLGISVRTLRNKLREYREAGAVPAEEDST